MVGLSVPLMVATRQKQEKWVIFEDELASMHDSDCPGWAVGLSSPACLTPSGFQPKNQTHQSNSEQGCTHSSALLCYSLGCPQLSALAGKTPLFISFFPTFTLVIRTITDLWWLNCDALLIHRCDPLPKNTPLTQ